MPVTVCFAATLGVAVRPNRERLRCAVLCCLVRFPGALCNVWDVVREHAQDDQFDIDTDPVMGTVPCFLTYRTPVVPVVPCPPRYSSVTIIAPLPGAGYLEARRNEQTNTDLAGSFLRPADALVARYELTFALPCDTEATVTVTPDRCLSCPGNAHNDHPVGRSNVFETVSHTLRGLSLPIQYAKNKAPPRRMRLCPASGALRVGTHGDRLYATCAELVVQERVRVEAKLGTVDGRPGQLLMAMTILPSEPHRCKETGQRPAKGRRKA